MGRESALWVRKGLIVRAKGVVGQYHGHRARKPIRDDTRMGFERYGVTAVLLCLVADDSHGKRIVRFLFGAAKEALMREVFQTPKRRGSSKKAGIWVRPSTIKTAILLLRLIDGLVRIFSRLF